MLIHYVETARNITKGGKIIKNMARRCRSYCWKKLETNHHKTTNMETNRPISRIRLKVAEKEEDIHITRELLFHMLLAQPKSKFPL